MTNTNNNQNKGYTSMDKDKQHGRENEVKKAPHGTSGTGSSHDATHNKSNSEKDSDAGKKGGQHSNRDDKDLSDENE